MCADVIFCCWGNPLKLLDTLSIKVLCVKFLDLSYKLLLPQ